MVLLVFLLLVSSFSVVVVIFGSVSLVGTTTQPEAITYPFQRKTFYANGRIWVFYSNGSHVVYKTSTGGSSWTWTTLTVVREGIQGVFFSVFFNGSHVFYAFSDTGVAGNPL